MNSSDTSADTALLAYQQADEEGIMVLVSRQAIHEAIDEKRALTAERDALREALEGMLRHSGVADAGADMKDAEDHEAERAALAALKEPGR